MTMSTCQKIEIEHDFIRSSSLIQKKPFHLIYRKPGFYFLTLDIKILLFGSCNKAVDKLAAYQLISELNSLQCKLGIKPNISEAKSERFTD